MRLFKSLIICAAAAIPAMVSAQARNATDSVSDAMATIVGQIVKPSIEKQYPGDDRALQLFVDGVRKAFDVSDADRLYYEGISEGLRMRDNLEAMRHAGYAVDDSRFIKSLIDVINGANVGFDQNSAESYLNSLHESAKSTTDAAYTAEQQAFLASQAACEGVITTPSGLVFEVIQEGEGSSPAVDDKVDVIYTGRFADGTVFDSSDGKAVTFPVGGLIKGFTEGLTMMRPGGKYRLYIPSDLGYGDKGIANVIPGGAALDFEVELVGINPRN